MNSTTSINTVYEDPRTKELGQRIYSVENMEHELNSDTYDLYRIMNGISLFKFKKKELEKVLLMFQMKEVFLLKLILIS
jgi:hypothetical protein